MPFSFVLISSFSKIVFLTKKLPLKTDSAAPARGRPRKRWIEDIEDDIQIMGIRG
jgi:hypothetical protein